MEKDGAEKKQDAVLMALTTVKWRESSCFIAAVLDELRLSDQDCGNQFTLPRCVLGSAWREGRLLLRQYRSFLKLLGDIWFPVDRLSVAPAPWSTLDKLKHY
jgi:hypothetical protein